LRQKADPGEPTPWPDVHDAPCERRVRHTTSGGKSAPAFSAVTPAPQRSGGVGWMKAAFQAALGALRMWSGDAMLGAAFVAQIARAIIKLLVLPRSLRRARKRHIGITPRPPMRLVAVRALQYRITLSKPIETGEVGHDASRDFSICLGASDNNHGNHGTLPVEAILKRKCGKFYWRQ